MANRFEYKVAELREGMIGGKMSGDKLEKLLNQKPATAGSSGRSPRST